MSIVTPMMQQYLSIKKQYSECLLFFRLGDFYELFFDDAILVSKELNITLTGRECGMQHKAPMCGVPYHCVEGYINKLIEKGFKVAICDQVEDAKDAKTLVKREVVRVITKGTTVDNTILDSTKNNYIMCVYENKNMFGVCFCDISTGEFKTTILDAKDTKVLIDEIAKISPSEIIANFDFSHADLIKKIFDLKIEKHSEWSFLNMNAYKKICDHFGILNLEGIGIEKNTHCICCCGALLDYLYETQKNTLEHISAIKFQTSENVMYIDISSRRNLELTETIREKSKKGSLLWVLDKTKTSMGSRMLRKWIMQPLLNKKEIEDRLDSVEELKDNSFIKEDFIEALNKVSDIERIMSKIVLKTSTAKDLIILKNSIYNLPQIKKILFECKATLLKSFYEEIQTLENLFNIIENSIVDDPPFSIREGGIIKRNFNKELDILVNLKANGTNWISELEIKEKKRTGIKNLKIKYNKVLGYYIEVTNSYKHLIPKEYIRKQTLVNCERLITEELKKVEEDILSADDKISILEYNIFCEIREKVLENTKKIQISTNIIAIIDVLVSLAEIADESKYTKPYLNTDGIIKLDNARHPVVEKISMDSFIPNDTYIDLKDDRIMVITGPNMAGKSTYMRQIALIVLMAQVGSFVPAEFANIAITDRIFTRVGASDDLAMGQSTFMVEMSEVANILNNATKNSLLILDEIGRGTSTFDGLSIAWSVLEYIADQNKIGAKAIFATHYHELTELEGKVSGIKNYKITVEEHNNDIVFLRKIVRGGSQSSYGIHVAKLAGVPKQVIERANDILNLLNKLNISKNDSQEDTATVYYNNIKKNKDDINKIIINELLKIDIESLTPRDALRMLSDLKSKSTQL